MRKRRKAMGKAIEFELHELKRKLAGQFPEMAGRDITKAFVAVTRRLDDDEYREEKRKAEPKPATVRLRSYPPVDQQAQREHFRQLHEQQLKSTQEREAQRQLSMRMIDVGYKALAKELHPDKEGGSSEAMSRLNRARHHQKQMA